MQYSACRKIIGRLNERIKNNSVVDQMMMKMGIEKSCGLIIFSSLSFSNIPSLSSIMAKKEGKSNNIPVKMTAPAISLFLKRTLVRDLPQLFSLIVE